MTAGSAGPVSVNLVKDVVEKQDGPTADATGQMLDLGQTQRQQKGLLLPLASKPLQWVIPDAEIDVILVDAHCGPAEPAVIVLGPVSYTHLTLPTTPYV